MDLTALITFLTGLAAGGSILYIRQRKLRMEELKKSGGYDRSHIGGQETLRVVPR